MEKLEEMLNHRRALMEDHQAGRKLLSGEVRIILEFLLDCKFTFANLTVYSYLGRNMNV